MLFMIMDLLYKSQLCSFSYRIFIVAGTGEDARNYKETIFALFLHENDSMHVWMIVDY